MQAGKKTIILLVTVANITGTAAFSADKTELGIPCDQDRQYQQAHQVLYQLAITHGLSIPGRRYQYGHFSAELQDNSPVIEEETQKATLQMPTKVLQHPEGIRY